MGVLTIVSTMVRRPLKSTDTASAQPCSHAGCTNAGEYKAPKSREHLREYIWLCMDHIREYNKAWDFFSGFDQQQIEWFMKDAVTGHRPTWKISNKIAFNAETLEDALAKMLGDAPRKRKTGMAGADKKLNAALSTLGMSPPATLVEIKSRYKLLVKKHHPDANNGNKKAEEKFKLITEAYSYLLRCYKPPS